MSDETIVNYLKAAGFYGTYNNYFAAVKMASVGSYALLGAFANLATKFFLVNHTEMGIGIIPADPITGKYRPDKILVISSDNIDKVTISRGLLFYCKISILSKDKKMISFQAHKKVLLMKKQEENLMNFIKKYSS